MARSSLSLDRLSKYKINKSRTLLKLTVQSLIKVLYVRVGPNILYWAEAFFICELQGPKVWLTQMMTLLTMKGIGRKVELMTEQQWSVVAPLGTEAVNLGSLGIRQSPYLYTISTSFMLELHSKSVRSSLQSSSEIYLYVWWLLDKLSFGWRNLLQKILWPECHFEWGHTHVLPWNISLKQVGGKTNVSSFLGAVKQKYYSTAL